MHGVLHGVCAARSGLSRLCGVAEHGASSWLRQDRRGRADLFGTAGFVASHMTLLTTPKELLFSVFLGTANGKRVREQPSL